MTDIKQIALAGAALTLFAAGASFAQPNADTDKDGKVSKAEFMAEANARFASGDTNGDGLLSKEERVAAHEMRKSERMSDHFDRLDENKDGVISRSEFEAAAEHKSERRMKRADRDGDGKLTKKDREKWMAERKERRSEMMKRYKERGEKGMRGEPGEKRGPHFKMDADGDGFISLSEHQAASEAMFMRLDVNGDGYLVKGEGRHRSMKKGQPR